MEGLVHEKVGDDVLSIYQPERKPDPSKNKYAVISLLAAVVFLISVIFIIFVSETIHPGILLVLIVGAIILGFLGLDSEKRLLAKLGIVISGIVFAFLSFLILITIPV